MKKRKMRRKWERKTPSRGYDVTIRPSYDRRQPRYDYLKYFKVVRYWVKRNYGLGLADLEMLLFLYAHNLFKRSDFKEFSEIFKWDRDRFDRLLREGWIHKWRDSKPGQVALYEVSFKGKKLVSSVYKKLSGEEPISESSRNNVIFKNNPPYTDKVYRRVIKKMNESTRQQQRHAQE